MRIALISDLHANFAAVRALEDDLREADAVLCLGDLLGYYCEVNEVMDWVRGHVSHCVLGNHDAFVLGGGPNELPAAVRFGIDHAAAVLDPDHAAWLGRLPLVWAGQLAGRSVLLAHGSPWNPLGDYLYADSPKLAGLADFQFDVLAFGQTHRHLLIEAGGGLVINPGAVGQSRDAATLGQAVAAIVNLADLRVTRLARPYDTSHVIRLARTHGAGEWIVKFLQPS